MESIENFSTKIAKTLFRAVQSSPGGGTALWITQHEGGGNLRSQGRFITPDGHFNNTTITIEDAEACDDAAFDWLERLAEQGAPLWEMLLGQADSEGNFNIIPIYPDDPRISELDLDGNALEVAHKILSE